jgi:hypothetical protein
VKLRILTEAEAAERENTCRAQPGPRSTARCEMPLGHRYEGIRGGFHAGRTRRGYWKFWPDDETELVMTPEQVIAELAGDLPPATLVLGPGAWALVSGAALDSWVLVPKLNAEAARIVRDSSYLMAARGMRKVALNLGDTTEQVQNMLLKVLEEPSSGTRFVLAAERRPLPTVVSRCRVLVVGREAQEESADPRDKAAVATALRAARTGQTMLLAQNLRNWVPAQAKLLTVWAAEAVSGRWSVFGPDTAPGVSADQAMRLLAELARYQGTKLGALVALDAVFSQG